MRNAPVCGREAESRGVPVESVWCRMDVGAWYAGHPARRARALRRLRARRSSSDRPPHTPASWPVSRAQRKQVSSTSQRRHTAFASSICSNAGPVFPIGKNSSGSSSRHTARCRQSMRWFSPSPRGALVVVSATGGIPDGRDQSLPRVCVGIDDSREQWCVPLLSITLSLTRLCPASQGFCMSTESYETVIVTQGHLCSCRH